MQIILDGTSRSGGYGFHRAGTSEEWRNHVAIPLIGNSNVVLAAGTMLAAPLLRWADEPAGGFHFDGESKIGKTLASAIGQSIWGKPFVPGLRPDEGDAAGAQQLLEYLQTIPFEMTVGERVPSARCASQSERSEE